MPILFPYWTASQPVIVKYATRKQARLKWTVCKACRSNLTAPNRENAETFSCTSLTKIMQINDVENPVITPATISHLKYLNFSSLKNQECKIFVDLTVKEPLSTIFQSKLWIKNAQTQKMIMDTMTIIYQCYSNHFQKQHSFTFRLNP